MKLLRELQILTTMFNPSQNGVIFLVSKSNELTPEFTSKFIKKKTCIFFHLHERKKLNIFGVAAV